MAALGVFAGPVSLLAVLCLFRMRGGFTFHELTVDPNALAGAPFYFGALSMLGLVLWGVAAGLGVVATVLIRTLGRRFWRLPLAVGIFSAVLMLDDLLLLHEQVMPSLLGVPERVTLGIYAAVLFAILITFHRPILAGRWDLLAISMACFGASVIADAVPGPYYAQPLIEDGPKLVGVFGWCAWQGSNVLQALTRVLGQSASEAMDELNPESAAAPGYSKRSTPLPMS